jgi:hypothetical protein
MRTVLFAVIGAFALVGMAFTIVFVGMHFGLFNVRGSIAERNSFFGVSLPSSAPCDGTTTACAWNTTPEWSTVAGGLTKDADVINRVSAETGVPARMIAAVVVPEQVRFFTSEREIFKSYFEPLKILGSLSQFSLGVSGIKEDTARAVENHASDATSPFYPGSDMAGLVAYAATGTPDTELYNRLTDPKDHYYSYLYTALYIKEIGSQWSRAGYDVSRNAGVVTTLFNIGFGNSKPNGAPQVGGAPIEVGGRVYAFGELGADFYNSNELIALFPKQV